MSINEEIRRLYDRLMKEQFLDYDQARTVLRMAIAVIASDIEREIE